MFNILKQIAKYVSTFIGVIALFIGSLYLVCLFGSEQLEVHAAESSQILNEQLDYPVLCYTLDVRNNNVTDAIIVNEIISVDHNNPYESAMKVRKNYRPGTTTVEVSDQVGEGMSACLDKSTGQEIVSTEVFNPLNELSQTVNKQLHTAIVYARYWHGYLVLYRPMMLWMNITHMRYCLAAVFAGLFALAMYSFNWRFGRDVAFMFGASLLCSGYCFTCFSLQGAPVFLVLMVSTILLLRRLDKIRDFGLFIFVVGCCTCYFDYLTTPLLTLGILSAIYLLKQYNEGRSWSTCLKSLVSWACLWLLGYAGTWICKWWLYDATVNDSNNMVSVGLQQCLVRMAHQSSIVTPLNDNYLFITLIVLGLSSLCTMLLGVIVVALNQWNWTIKGFNKMALPFLVLATFPIIWFIALANHTIGHYFYTYKIFAVYMIGVLLATHTLGTPQPNHGQDSNRI